MLARNFTYRLWRFGDATTRVRAHAQLPQAGPDRQGDQGHSHRPRSHARGAGSASRPAPTYISDVERGVRNPSWDVVARLAEGMGVPAAVIAAEYDRLAE